MPKKTKTKHFMLAQKFHWMAGALLQTPNDALTSSLTLKEETCNYGHVKFWKANKNPLSTINKHEQKTFASFVGQFRF